MTQPTRSSRQNRPSLAQAATASPAASSPATEPADDIVTDLLQRVLARVPDLPANDVMAVEQEIRRDWGGDRPYIAKSGEAGRIERTRREEAIRAEHRRGERPGFLSRKWGLSIRHVQRIVKEG
ncbi:MAG: hypothetical protein IAE85_09965 [Anaerolinea sp.]|nr:hypothetical protein [Anaerolinea sp.]